MNGQADSRKWWKRTGPLLVVLLAAGLLVSGPPLHMGAAPAATTLAARIQFEGYIREQLAGRWRIGDVPVQVDQNTVIDEQVAPAVLYAYVVVTATHLDGQPLHADGITVVRAASNAGSKLEISGTLVKQGAPENGVADWSISGTLVEVTNETKIIGQPAESCLLTVLAEDRGGILYALQIQVIADQPSSVPVEFEGVVKSANPAAGSWVVDGSTVYYDAKTAFLNGMPEVGQTIEIRAGLASDGRLLASLVHIKTAPAAANLGAYVVSVADGDAGSQDWNVLVFPVDGGAPVPATLHIAANTWIDRSRAVPQAGEWAEVRAVPDGSDSYRATTVRLSRPAKVNFRARLQPVEAKTRAGRWMKTDKHRVWLPEGVASDILSANLAVAGSDRTIDGLLLGNGVIWAERIGR